MRRWASVHATKFIVADSAWQMSMSDFRYISCYRSHSRELRNCKRSPLQGLAIYLLMSVVPCLKCRSWSSLIRETQMPHLLKRSSPQSAFLALALLLSHCPGFLHGPDLLHRSWALCPLLFCARQMYAMLPPDAETHSNKISLLPKTTGHTKVLPAYLALAEHAHLASCWCLNYLDDHRVWTFVMSNRYKIASRGSKPGVTGVHLGEKNMMVTLTIKIGWLIVLCPPLLLCEEVNIIPLIPLSGEFLHVPAFPVRLPGILLLWILFAWKQTPSHPVIAACITEISVNDVSRGQIK